MIPEVDYQLTRCYTWKKAHGIYHEHSNMGDAIRAWLLMGVSSLPRYLVLWGRFVLKPVNSGTLPDYPWTVHSMYLLAVQVRIESNYQPCRYYVFYYLYTSCSEARLYLLTRYVGTGAHTPLELRSDFVRPHQSSIPHLHSVS